jgi:hypothetical protein
MTHNVLQPWRLTAWLQSTRLTILSRLHESRYAPAGLRWATVRMTHDGLQPAWITMCSSMQDSRHDTVCLTHDMLLSSWPTMCSSLRDSRCSTALRTHDLDPVCMTHEVLQAPTHTICSSLNGSRCAPAFMNCVVLYHAWLTLCSSLHDPRRGSCMCDSRYDLAWMTPVCMTQDFLLPEWPTYALACKNHYVLLSA